MKKINPRKKASQERSKITVESILQSAEIILKEYGLKKLTTNKIVEKAGISIGSLYQYFPGKEAILTILIERQFKKDLQKFKDKLDSLSPETHDLKSAITEAVEFFMSDFSAQSKLYRELLFSVVSIRSLSFTLKHDQLMQDYLSEFFSKFKDEVRIDLDLEFYTFFFQYIVKGLKFGISFSENNSKVSKSTEVLAEIIYQQVKS